MDCYYHQGRESVKNCEICGKPICQECSLEIGEKTYCKDCLENIIGSSTHSNNNESSMQKDSSPARLEKKDMEETPSYRFENNIAQQNTHNFDEPDVDSEVYVGFKAEQNTHNFDEPVRNIPSRENILKDILTEDTPNQESNYNDPKFSSNNNQNESPYAVNDFTFKNEPNQFMEEKTYFSQESQKPNNEINYPNENYYPQDDFIYPDHEYQPEITSARQELENKYEKYLDDLYFDDNELPLSEQLAKDEEEYGSLTKKPYNKTKQEYEEYYYEEEPISDNTYQQYGTSINQKEEIKAINQQYQEQPNYNQNPYNQQQNNYNKQQAYNQQTNYNQNPYNQQQNNYNEQQAYNQQTNYNQNPYNQQQVYNQQTVYQDQPIYRELEEEKQFRNNNKLQYENEFIAQEYKSKGIRSRNKNKNNNDFKPSTKSIHNIDYSKKEKEPLNAIDIFLTIILIILIILVIFYVIYLFTLTNTYPTFLDALYGLSDPQTLFSSMNK